MKMHLMTFDKACETFNKLLIKSITRKLIPSKTLFLELESIQFLGVRM